jgi:ectoine hydroxylase-related dioxygenase (phytanoyl-CoA dioxygenase family)
MARLRGHRLSLPPVFVFMYDATWALVRGMWDFAEAMLGSEAVLEPSVAAFKLDHALSAAGRRYCGNNFGRPHRDYGRAEALDAAGRPRVLSVWLPLNDVSLANGPMYVVPRAHDGAYAHADQGALAPDVPLFGVRALAPHAAGTLMAWNGNVIHWGGACEREGALDPRASLALVFRRADVPADPNAPPISRAAALAMGTAERLRLVADALRYFSAWYDVDKELGALLRDAEARMAAAATP